MPSERVQRQVDRLLDEAEQAFARRDWALLSEHAQDILRLDPENADALAFLAAAHPSSPTLLPRGEKGAAPPDAFANGRYTVKKFLGEGGKKKVYLAHDTLLDRDVAFALIKTEGLDDVGRDRITREAQAMGRLGAHPHIVSVFDLGEEADGQPYIVTELMGGGDVEGLIEHAPEHRPPLERSLQLGIEVCQGLEFAHRHGIVHRDLKPGNVWLTAEGTAKLGDFGLAVALDKSRLTQAGMMVGTVSYMPPEQAMGGEVTPQSDLYSLGAMLYELVCGRPPFVGDESVAIITQHLNSAPVSPTWHTASVPPALEILILRLLEKDPAKRPASAGEVRVALEAVRTHRPPGPVLAGDGEDHASRSGTGEGRGAGEPRAAGSPAALDNPLYRRTFVGREAELRQLQGAYDAATAGQGSLATVVGEPGIGKTSLCEQLATYAAIRGGRTLVGHCYEEGSLSLPYLPIVEAMRSYVLVREPDELRKDLGSGAGDIARIVSEVRERVSVESKSTGNGDPEEARYRLYQAVTEFLRNAATVQPLVIVLEDLHDADRGTLDLLLHLARNLAGARLLIVGTYRDIEVDRSHPLSATLAELRRTAGFRRVLLRGLTADEVQRMLSGLSGQDLRWELAEAVHRQTEGNPLFVQEVLRYLVEEGLVTREGGRSSALGNIPLAVSIPEGLRDVIGKRLSRLSSECNRLLAIAAVIGRDFRLETLQAVANAEEEPLLAALEEATRAAVLSEQARVGDVQYRFAHAFFRQTLYEELSVPRRLRMHQEVARVLERQYGNRLDEHAAELAEHFAQSTDPEDLYKAIACAERASQRSLAVYAYGEAVRHLEQALDIQEVLDPDQKAKRCDLLLALGDVLQAVGEPLRAAREAATQALACATAAGDQARALRACLLALRALARLGGARGGSEFREWAEQADNRVHPDTAERAQLDVDMSSMLFAERRFRSAWERACAAQELASRLGNLEARYRAAAMQAQWCAGPGEAELRTIIAELSLGSRAGVSPRGLNFFLFEAGCSLLGWGDGGVANRLFQELHEIATKTRYPSALQRAEVTQILTDALAGRWEEALARAEAFMMQAEELSNPSWAWRQVSIGITRIRLSLGRADEALAGVDAAIPSDEAYAVLGTALRAICLAALGRIDEARIVAAPVLDPQGLGPEADYAPTGLVALLLELAVTLRDHEAVARLTAQLSGFSDRVAMEQISATAVGRHLGAAAALLGDPEAAQQYYEQTLEVCAKIGFRPEIALTHLQMAELLLGEAGAPADGMNRAPAPEDGPLPSPLEGRLGAPQVTEGPGIRGDSRVEALRHLDFAIAEFREMKMQPALERALRHKEVLRA